MKRTMPNPETTKLLPAQNYEPIIRELEGTPMSNPTTDPWGHDAIPRDVVAAGIEALLEILDPKWSMTMEEGEFLVCEVYRRMKEKNDG
jgi:hypothetical protein